MVPPNSEGIPPVPTYSGSCYVDIFYIYGTITLYGWLSQAIQLPMSPNKQSYNPTRAVTQMVWANPCSLATTYGITVVFSS
jgi:hypothetical protein